MITKPWHSSLTIQILLLLTLALMPLGAVAIYQTSRVAAEAEQNAELALLSITGRAAKAEELIIERAFGAARFFGNIAEEFLKSPERCARDLGRFVETNPRYSFIGVLPMSGLMTCTSNGLSYNFSTWPTFEQAMRDQSSTIVVNQDAPASGESVFIISEPFEIDGQFAGYISVSIPHSGLPDQPDRLVELGLEEILTFNENGDILTARNDLTAAAERTPIDQDLASLKTTEARAFSGLNKRGEYRTFTIVPIEGSPASALGIWRTKDGLASGAAGLVRPTLFPTLMWMASMAVAMLSVYMLVLRHLNKLRFAMDGFTRERELLPIEDRAGMPNELRALYQNFDRMINDILQDEARLENAIREKGILVKEIHHRVKNNLQLISSIMNMQIRNAEHEETKAVISSLQDRVRSLATIHRDLYQSQQEGRVDAGALLREILDHSFDMAVSENEELQVKTEIDTVLLYPDQAVPLSLLAAEGTTNALKYLGAPDGSTPWIKAKLEQNEQRCMLTLANSVGETTSEGSTGLGSDLINAFAIQLGGRIDVKTAGNRYVMTIDFPIEDFIPDARDF